LRVLPVGDVALRYAVAATVGEVMMSFGLTVIVEVMILMW